MDQSRWLIVFAVVLCMIFTLTILGKMYQPDQIKLSDNPETSYVRTSVARRVDKGIVTVGKLDIEAMYKGYSPPSELRKESYMPESPAEEERFFRQLKNREVLPK